VTLAVKDSNAEQILLTPISDNEQAVQDKILTILEQADIKATKSNVSVVRGLLQNEMPVNKDTINQVIRALAKYPDMPVKDLLFMIKNNIPITSQNIQSLQVFMDQKPLFFEQLQNTIQTISDLILTSEASTLAVGSENKPNSPNMDTQTIPLDSTNLEQKLGFTDSQIETIDILKGFTQGSNTQLDIASKFSSATISQLTDMLNAMTGTDKNVASSLANIVALNNAEAAATVLTQATGISDSEVASLSDLNTIIEQLGLDKEALASLRTDLMKPLIMELVEKQMLLQYETFQKPGSVSKYFEQLYNQIAFISKRLASDSNEGAKEKDATGIKDGLQFVKAMNQHFQFLELPMLFNDQMLSGELYILDQGASKKSSKEAVSALLQLDFLNLGHLDVYVNKMQESVDLHFYTENQDVTTLITDSIAKLNEQLVEKGFVVKQMLVEVKKETIDIREAVLNEKAADNDLKHITFDIRV
jgi:flagellar hook-length control protein FliK